jgi:lipoprotein-anchoring transpeptidase ErfK/SrfK
MTALRQLSAFYVATAGAYAIAMALSAHPDWSSEAENSAAYLRDHVVSTATAFDAHVLRPDFHLAQRAGRTLGHRIAMAFETTPVAHVRKLARAMPAKHSRVLAQTETSSPALPPPSSNSVSAPEPPADAAAVPAAPPPADTGSTAPPPSTRSSESDDANAHRMTLVPQAAAPQQAPENSLASLPPGGAPNAGEIIRVEERLKDSLTSDLYENFELFLYVSKADAGPWAQRMYVFQKDANDNLNLLYNWPVSTGREDTEKGANGKKLETSTPPGYYELDPHRSYEKYHSAEWDQDMPYAMFFRWEKDHRETGLAIHAATDDDVDKLGHRASSGCIHLSEDNARTLFTMIRSQYKGLAPRFAYDRRTGTMSNDGILLHDAKGNLQMAQGYKVLVFIEDYGGQNVVAALY